MDRSSLIKSPQPVLAQQTQSLLDLLARLMAEANMWSTTPPSAAAMASSAPFACDSMPFEHWLQFIFIAKMQALLVGQQPLPNNIALTPMAEQMFAGRDNSQPVINCLEQIDALLAGHR